MKTMKTGGCLRQGDVLLVRVADSRITKAHKEVPRENGRVVVALGESSMHAHVFRDPGVCMLRREGAGQDVREDVIRVLGLCDLLTEGGELAPGKPRHTPVSVPPGTYQLVIQREMDSEYSRRVED